jgi:hypothetical protein
VIFFLRSDLIRTDSDRSEALAQFSPEGEAPRGRLASGFPGGDMLLESASRPGLEPPRSPLRGRSGLHNKTFRRAQPRGL